MGQKGGREGLGRLVSLRAELQEFSGELLRVAQVPYKPDLNDGVLISSAHFQLLGPSVMRPGAPAASSTRATSDPVCCVTASGS